MTPGCRKEFDVDGNKELCGVYNGKTENLILCDECYSEVEEMQKALADHNLQRIQEILAKR